MWDHFFTPSLPGVTYNIEDYKFRKEDPLCYLLLFCSQ